MNLFPSFISALVLTILSEYIVLLFLMRENPIKIALIVILINLITNPALNFFHLIYEVPVLILEIMVVVGEMVMIKYLIRIPWQFALVCSCAMNVFSFFIGVLVYV